MKLVLEDAENKLPMAKPGAISGGLPESLLSDGPKPQRQLRTRSVDSQLEEWRTELDTYHGEMAQFISCDPSEIFRKLAAYSARASYIRGQVMRVDNRALTTFRTKELDPFITTLDYQFKVWSRYQTTVQMEWEIANNGRI